MRSLSEFYWNVALGILMARHGTDAVVARGYLARLARVCEMDEQAFARFLVILTEEETKLGNGEVAN